MMPAPIESLTLILVFFFCRSRVILCSASFLLVVVRCFALASAEPDDADADTNLIMLSCVFHEQ